VTGASGLSLAEIGWLWGRPADILFKHEEASRSSNRLQKADKIKRQGKRFLQEAEESPIGISLSFVWSIYLLCV